MLHDISTQGFVLNIFGVLRRHDHGFHRGGNTVHIAHGNLGLSIGAQIRQRAVFAHLGQTLGQTMRQIDRHGHERGSFVAGIAEHHALVSRADAFVRIGLDVCAVLGLPRFVNALGDVGALLVNGIHHAAGAAVEAVFGTVVADVGQHAAHDVLHVHVRLGANFSGNHHKAGGDQRLACATKLRRVGRLAGRGDVALLRKIDLLRKDGIKDGIGNLIADFVRMAFRHGLGRKDVV